jgi:hypothetical protein
MTRQHPAGAPASEIYREFERQLAAWEVRYAGDPAREILRLYLLALEREENVAVAYAANVLGPRLAKLCVPGPVREVMQEALAQVWRDERWHAEYVRRMLLDIDKPVVRARTLLQRTAGAIGGWSVSVRQHLDWSEAPLSRAAATVLVWAGEILGRVPQAVRGHLTRCSFRDFCRYNVHTESTAWLCWERLVTLAVHVPEISAERVEEFRSIADDEERHRVVFGILADALTEQDRIRDDVTEGSLAARIEDVIARAVRGGGPTSDSSATSFPRSTWSGRSTECDGSRQKYVP